VVVEGPVIKTKWPHIPITFSTEDINLASFPHTDAMVVTVHINRWDVTRILADNGSQAEVLFLSTFEKMGYDRRRLKESTKPLYGFGGKRIEPVGVITLPISFGGLENPRTEYITFDVVDMHYPYNAIFGRGLLNTFEAVLHSAYLCLKVSAAFGVISVFGNQKDARNIEQGFALGHKNIYFVREESEQYQQSACATDPRPSAKYRPTIEANGETKKIPLDPRVPDKAVLLGMEMSPEEEAELLAFLDKNSDVFAWSTSDLIGVSRDIIEHKLQVNPAAKPRKQ
jgi:hypothetical protein